MKVEINGKRYYATKEKDLDYFFVYQDVLHYILGIPSAMLTIYYNDIKRKTENKIIL